jgi:hypothetical protein
MFPYCQPFVYASPANGMNQNHAFLIQTRQRPETNNQLYKNYDFFKKYSLTGYQNRKIFFLPALQTALKLFIFSY